MSLIILKILIYTTIINPFDTKGKQGTKEEFIIILSFI